MIVVGALAGAWACGRDEPAIGEARLVVHDESRVLVSSLERRPTVGKTGDVIRGGDRVRVARGGATLEMADDASLELRSGSEVVMGRRPELRRGDVLVTTDETPLAVATDHAEAWVEGVVRLRRSLAVSAAAYRGQVHVNSAGRGLDVPALREVSVPARGLVPGRTTPITYRHGDAWDRRFLGAAMELGEMLEARSRGFSAQARRGLPVTLAELVAPVSGGRTEMVTAGDRAAGERIVGAAVAAAAGGEFSRRWADVFSFRDEGAPWGLVVLDQKIRDHDGLVGLIDGMIARGVRALFASPPLVDADTAAASAPLATSSGPVGSSTPATTVPGTDPSPEEPLVDPPSTGTPVDEPVDDGVDIISGLIDDTTSTLEDTTSEIDDATGGTEDVLVLP